MLTRKQRVRNKSNNFQSVYASSISCPSAPNPNYRKMTRVPSLNRIHKSGNYAEGRSTVVVAANRNGDSSAPANQRSQKEKSDVDEKEYMREGSGYRLQRPRTRGFCPLSSSQP